jgi:hypothetical protein
LAALADSSFSAAFCLAAGYQLVVLGFGCVRRVRLTSWHARAAEVPHLLVPKFLLAGFSYATRSVA